MGEPSLRLATELLTAAGAKDAQRDILRLEYRMLMALHEQASSQMAAAEKLSNMEAALVELQARSPWLVLAAMAIVWIADTAAYFAGRAFGRRKLAPLVSPGKTWEGVFGGLAASVLLAALVLPLLGLSWSSLPALALLTLATAAISVVGDLFESLMKRHSGVKDSGAIFPGHGGLMDRLDSLLAALPVFVVGKAWLGL